MKRFIFPCILCLCWLMISCSSTPSPQEAMPEEVIQEPVEPLVILEQEPEQALEQEESVLEQDVLQQSDLALNQEHDENDIEEKPSVESPVLETIAALDNSIPFDEGTSSEADLEVIVQDDSQDYLQEIEIIDLFQEDDLSAGYNQEDMAVVIEDDTAVVVEQLPEQNENLVSQDTESPVVVESTAQTEPVIVDAEVNEQLSMELENPEPVDQETETLDSVAIESEAIEPVDIDATQGVLDDFVDPSRSVVMDKDQYLDIRYPGTGWVYLGEVTKDGTSIGTPSLTYFGRRRTSEDTSFTMKSTKTGTTILHFYKQDVLTATFIDDYLEVTITDEIAQNGFRVIAPSYESLVPGYQDTIPQPKDFSEVVSSEKSQETPLAVSQAEETLPVAPSQTQSVVTQNQSLVQNQVPAVTAASSSVAPAPQEVTPAVTEASSSVAPAPREGTPAVTAASSSVAPAPREGTPAVTATSSSVAPAPREVVPAVTEASSSVAPAPQEVTPATVIVPPQTTTVRTVERNSPAQISTLQQETYQPESPSNTTSQDNFNPETGMSMENMDLPWVSEELERQRTADINRSTLNESPEEIDSSQQQAQDMLLAQAQDYFHAEDHPAALETLNKFFEIAISDFDAAYYLKGQVLESKSSIKNIKEAQKAYKHVIDSYPQSPFWERARNRYTYLSRFYFDIR